MRTIFRCRMKLGTFPMDQFNHESCNHGNFANPSLAGFHQTCRGMCIPSSLSLVVSRISLPSDRPKSTVSATKEHKNSGPILEVICILESLNKNIRMIVTRFVMENRVVAEFYVKYSQFTNCSYGFSLNYDMRNINTDDGK